MARGKVKWFNDKKGYGFIVDPTVPSDVFVHYSVIMAPGFKTLAMGEEVEYELENDGKGAKAKNVTPLNNVQPTSRLHPYRETPPQ